MNRKILSLMLGMSIALYASAVRAEGLPWKQPLFESETHVNFALFPELQSIFRYGSPSELTDLHSLRLMFGPRFGPEGHDAPYWVLPLIGVGAGLNSDEREFQSVVGLWMKFSTPGRSLSYQFMGELSLVLPTTDRGLSVDVRHRLDYNIVLPVEPPQDDVADRWNDEPVRRWRRDRAERDPWKRDHWLLQFGLHAQHRDLNFDLGPAMTAKYHWLSVGIEYLLGFQEANRGQTVRVTLSSELGI